MTTIKVNGMKCGAIAASAIALFQVSVISNALRLRVARL